MYELRRQTQQLPERYEPKQVRKLLVQMTEYILTDANGEPIRGQRYDNPGDAIEARAILMAEHDDGDDVTIEEQTDD